MKERASFGEDKMISCSEHLNQLVCAKKALQYHKEREHVSSWQPPNVTNNQVVQKDEYSGEDTVERKKP